MNRNIFNSIAIFIAAFLLLQGCQNQADRKIKLSDISSPAQNISQPASSVLQVSPRQQRYIAILNFKNETGDPALNWLRRGLADMFVTELSQSPYLNIIPITRIQETIQNHEKQEGELEDPSVAAMIARETDAEMVLRGRIFSLRDSLGIEVELLSANTARIIRKEQVFGKGLEQIFSMVSALSDRVRSNMRGDLEEIEYTGVNLANMTHSIEAFRYYSRALENTEKFLHEEAEKYLEKAIQEDSTFAAAYLRLAELKYSLGKEEEGKQKLMRTKQLAEKLSESDQVTLEILEKRIQGKYWEVITALEEAVSRFPTDVELRLNLARMYRALGDYDRALQEFETVLDLDPNRKMVYNDLGYVHAHRGDFTSAINYIDKYQEFARNEPNPYDSKGEILMMAGRLEEAKEQFNRALQQWPTFFYSARNLAQVHTELGNFDKTMEYMEQLRTLVPSEKFLQEHEFYKALILWRFGEIEQAERLFMGLIEKAPYNCDPVLLAGEMLESTGNNQKAGRLYDAAFSRFESYIQERDDLNHEVVDNFIRLVLQANLPADRAIPAFENLTSNHSLSEFYGFIAHITLSLLYLRNGDLDQAQACSPGYNAEQFNTLFARMERGSASLWRYIYESLAYLPEIEPTNHPFVKLLLSISRETNRKDLEAAVFFARSYLYGKQGRMKSVTNEYQDAGAPLEEDWLVIGPFATTKVSPFHHSFPPEKSIDIKAIYQEAGREIKWISAHDGIYDGYIDLKSIFGHGSWTVGYGLTYVFSPDQRQVQIRLGADEACKLWLNDELIWQHYIKGDAVIDRDIVSVLLQPGYNKLLLKVTNSTMDWGYYLRITDGSGNGYYDIAFHSPEVLAEEGFAARQN